MLMRNGNGGGHFSRSRLLGPPPPPSHSLSHTNGTVCGAENRVCFDCCPEVAAQRDNANLFDREQIGGLAFQGMSLGFLGLGEQSSGKLLLRPRNQPARE